MGAEVLQVGRDSEREQLAAVLRDSVAGRPGAVVVAGEPGIGKTSLVAGVASGPAASDHLVLWGRCLRFGADSSPYLPIGQMLTQWHRQADESERRRVLSGAQHLATIAPALGSAPEAVDFARVLPLVATVLDRISETVPLVLVVDDAQWGDGSSLDLLAYLVAGFTEGQRLCLLITYRDTDLGEGHRLHGWLADVSRLPSVSQVRLERLGFADSEELVSRLRGEVGSSQLAAEVFERAGGNPYYTELLVRGSEPGRDEGSLREALLGSWHRLGPDARELLQLLAVGGRPVSLEVLARLVAARDGAPNSVPASLADATAAGLTTAGPRGEAWFHHPLVAEVVATTLTPASTKQVHREYVEVLESSADLPEASRAAHLALHHDGAGEPDRAFAWSLRAADEAAAVRGYAEVCEHLHRACRLWDDVRDATRCTAGDRTELWRRASEAAWSAGEHDPALRLREEAITAIDPDVDPVRAVRLRLPLHHWRASCGHESPTDVASARQVLHLAAHQCPGTPEHVQALAKLAFIERWNQHPMADTHAVEAVRMARRSSSPEALAWALSVRSATRADANAALADALEALNFAHEVRTPELVGFAAREGANSYERTSQRSCAAELLLRTFRELIASGSVHDAMWASPAFAVVLLIELGRWEEAGGVLRELLSRRLAAEPSAEVRGSAAMLAFRRGHMEAGNTHLRRAHELLQNRWGAGDLLALIEVEAMWTRGELRQALHLAVDLMPEEAPLDPDSANNLLVLAGHAAADLADEPACRAEAVALLERVERLRGPEETAFAPLSPADAISPAYGRLFAAERARCHGEADTVPLWRAAVSACGKAGQVWHEALASYRLARALLVERRSRSEAGAALRHAVRLASDLGAQPIIRGAEEMARQAHISLAEPAPTEPATGRPDDPLSSLTAREREVLSHLVAGRTYAEIAQALFISEKTVSVHVSNLLRKTGTSSRLEVAELVRRTSVTP